MELADFHKQLNSFDVLPPRGFRRDCRYWPLVSYVNTVIACVLSENHKGIALFMERAGLFMEDNSGDAEAAGYCDFVEAYFTQVRAEFGIEKSRLLDE